MANKSNPSFIVRSRRATDRRPDLCWMNIGVEKLKKAAKLGREDYYFHCHVGDEDFNYCLNAQHLLETFKDKKVRIKRSRGRDVYNFYIEYGTGELVHSLSECHSHEKENTICKLKREKNGKIGKIKKIEEMSAESGNFLPSLLQRQRSSRRWKILRRIKGRQSILISVANMLMRSEVGRETNTWTTIPIQMPK